VTSGYRRRILIEPGAGRVTAELEDDYHRMVVTLTHHDGIISTVQSEMKRSPWTLCPGAMDQLARTFTGVALADVAKRGEKTANCTHLHDLTIFGAAHADEAAPVAYDILVTDPVDGMRTANLSRNGTPLLHWVMQGEAMAEIFTAPEELAGRQMGQLNDVIAKQDKTGAEAMRILRWAAMVAHGRSRDMPAGMPATAFPAGSCFNFQADRAPGSFRRPGADIDFSRPGAAPMADREEAFTTG
jgi:hypothetical protein